jgi:hypothetical protein
MSASNVSEALWVPFEDGDMWCPGVVLWLWEASWKEPRLAIASHDEDEMGDWKYARGNTEVGAAGETWPTHCSVLVAPVSPQPGA